DTLAGSGLRPHFRMNPKTLAALCVLALPFAFPARPQDAPSGAALRGLSGVTITIEPLTPLMQSAGLKDEDLRREIDRRLRNSKIPVLTTPADLAKAPGRPYLFVDIAANQPKDAPVISWNVTLSLNQVVVLKRDARIETIAPTWALRRDGLSGERAFAAAIQRAASDLTDKFIAAYKSVNK
ncbi:MAG: hypothetical protein ACRD8O_10980, partial [Bryobacteraceae bacterium]